MKLTPGMQAADAARAALPPRVERFFASGRKAIKKSDAVALHSFRVEAKKLRYSLEIFAPVYGPQLNKRLSELKKLQDLLGRLNDLVTARELAADLPGSVPLRGFLDRSERDVRERLEKYWTEHMDAHGNDRRWLRYLTQYAGATVRRLDGAKVTLSP